MYRIRADYTWDIRMYGLFVVKREKKESGRCDT